MTIRTTPEELIHGWHLDKRVNLSHLITTFTVTVAVIVWVLALQERVKVVEVTQDIILTSQKDVRGDIQDMRSELNSKLDVIVDHQYEHLESHAEER